MIHEALRLLAAQGQTLVDTAQGFVVPVVGAAAGGYALLRIAKSDQNWDGLIAGLKSENSRMALLITEKDALHAEKDAKLATLTAWEYEREQTIADLHADREARKRMFSRLTAEQIKVARLEATLLAAGVNPADAYEITEGIIPEVQDVMVAATEPRGVLLLDDDPLALQLASDFLLMTRPNWTVRTALSVPEAQAADMHGIHVVVVDWNMPGGENTSGYLTWLREKHPTRDVVVLSGHPPDVLREKMDAEGVAPDTLMLYKPEVARMRMQPLIDLVEASV